MPYAEDIKRNGVKGLMFVGEPETLALLLQALANIGWKLDWVLGSSNMYDAKLTSAAGKALADEPVYLGLGFPPFEAADKVPAHGRVPRAVQAVQAEGQGPHPLSMNAMSAWLLFAQAAKQCGADLTRRCVYDNSKKPTTWDAGGLWSPADLTDSTAGSPCFTVVKATPKGFEVIPWRLTTTLLNCDPANIITASKPSDLPKPLTLESVGKSIDDVD